MTTSDLSNINNEVGIMSKNIVEYGAFAVILAVFLLLFIIVVCFVFMSSHKQMKKLMEDNEEQKDLLVKQNQELLNSILELKDSKSTTKIERDIIKTFMSINFVFKDACKTTLDLIDAHRVGVYVFHNGNSSIHGLPFFKMSCIGEWVAYGNGINNQGKAHTDLPLHLFSQIIEELYDNGEYCSERDKDKVNTALSDFVGNAKINYVFISSIYDDYDNIAGFSISEFKSAPDEETLKNIRKEMNVLNDRIRNIIINSKNNQNNIDN